MPNLYQDYTELETFFGEQAFYKLDVDSLTELSPDTKLRSKS